MRHSTYRETLQVLELCTVHKHKLQSSRFDRDLGCIVEKLKLFTTIIYIVIQKVLYMKYISTCSCLAVGSVYIVPSSRIAVVIAATKYFIGNPAFNIAMHVPLMQHESIWSVQVKNNSNENIIFELQYAQFMQSLWITCSTISNFQFKTENLKDTEPSLQTSCSTIVMADRGCIVVSMVESHVFLINLSIAFSAQPDAIFTYLFVDWFS